MSSIHYEFSFITQEDVYIPNLSFSDVRVNTLTHSCTSRASRCCFYSVAQCRWSIPREPEQQPNGAALVKPDVRLILVNYF